ncbi:ExeM/NucH family extracellular endonuclease [Cognaticolwellia beringensis]|uniref:LTD domain-containing protein n=1 Tax=Cognaticolwellia beringensis TaxID=1967665 RepID=A0A222GA72_9GAMM|nr:ExeM/NucH family extracellular endonuclease [Cognaticolwellia beringensis]ASP48779.1 hypothetical protein B5D82_13995 [Cognaticolwellia beringensis]
MKLKSPIIFAYFCASLAQASDIADACFNCPPLDKVADATNFNDGNYYADAFAAINSNLPASEIKTKITNAISQNHKNLSYSEVWSALTQTDEDPSNTANVILLYSGISLPKMSNGSGSQSTNQDNWNREHVWPKSHGFSASSLEAYTDIHHLRPTDISVNSSRGNLDFDNSDSPLSEAPENRVDNDSFEPRDSVKGDVARMVFYMDTRYEGSDATPDLRVVDRLTSVGDSEIGRLCRLLEWHAADPVDATEQNRHNRIYEYQGNRNPFVDHPEWVNLLFSADACAGTGDTGGGDTGGGDTGGGDTGGGDTGGGDTGAPSSSSALFISEYVEGSSYNKAIELFNASNTDIDLAAENYQLGRFSNGGTTASMINLDGIVAANGTFVLVNTRASTDLLALADQESGSLSHNGDDAYVLYKNNEVVDSFGLVGEDPGSAWGSETYSTKDNTLRRNSNVVSGDTVINDTFEPSQQWTGFGKDEFSDIGQHVVVNPEIFISEYIEGGSLNKALEFYNPGPNAIDLSAGNYQLGRFSNGSIDAVMIDLDGVIAGNSVYVIANSGAATAILDVANQTSNNVSHNGDDAYVLYKNNVVIDSIGRVGEDPGSQWGSDLQSTKDNTLVRKSTITMGDTVVDDAFDPALEWDGYAKDTFDYIGAHTSNGAGEPISLIGECADPTTLISAVQGAGFSSPFVGESHIIEGVVTGSFPALNGFFMQEEAIDQDADPLTSEGIFVATTGTEFPAVNSVVRVIGKISESYGKTQINQSEATLICGADSVLASNLSLPFSSSEARESIEGMLVTISGTLTVTDNYNLGRYGEVALSNGRLYVPTNMHLPGTVEYSALAARNALNKVTLDDGINGSNPENIIYPTNGLSAANTLRAGDTVTSLTGLVDYSFGNYRIIPVEAPTFDSANLRTEAPELVTGNLRIASFNVLNYFNGDGLGGGFPTSRGADSSEEFDRQRSKIIDAITKMDADIIGLLEMENDGFGEHSAIQDLVHGLNLVAPANVHYSFVNPNISADPATGIELLGGDAIKVAMIYNDKAVTEFGTTAYLTGFPFEYHNRPPMVQSFRATETGERLTVAINHFRSKGCSSSGGVENEDKLDGQGCYNLRRVQAAEALTAWLSTYPTGIADDDILIIGDLNAYTKEDPVSTIENAGYTNLAQKFIGDMAYSYAYQGEIGTLDHALASASLTDKVLDVTEWHINADEPTILDYNVEYKSDEQLVTMYDSTAYRASDHDPVLVEIEGVTPLISVKEVHTDLGTKSRWSTFKFQVPETSVSFTATITGGAGNVDLYVREGKKPNTQKFDCRPMLAGNEESCVMDLPASGTWYIRLRGERHYSDVTLTLEALYPEPL